MGEGDTMVAHQHCDARELSTNVFIEKVTEIVDTSQWTVENFSTAERSCFAVHSEDHVVAYAFETREEAGVYTRDFNTPAAQAERVEAVRRSQPSCGHR
jgi:hypothetical protein